MVSRLSLFSPHIQWLVTNHNNFGFENMLYKLRININNYHKILTLLVSFSYTICIYIIQKSSSLFYGTSITIVKGVLLTQLTLYTRRKHHRNGSFITWMVLYVDISINKNNPFINLRCVWFTCKWWRKFDLQKKCKIVSIGLTFIF